MRTKIFNLIIIDESGSMISIKQAAIDSVNETIQTIREAEAKHEDQEHIVSLVSFNNQASTIYDCVPIKYVKELTDESYRPNCGTALYDAMGMSLNALRKNVGDDDKVLVTVVTDGYENSSREYSGNAIKALIDELKAKGWVFAYIGANHDVEKVAATISITNVMAFDASPIGTARMSGMVAKSRSLWYDKVAMKDCSIRDDNYTFFDDVK